MQNGSSVLPKSVLQNRENSIRLMSPIGLDIGSRTPEETAISICAEIIGKRVGRSVPSLSKSAGPIHK